MRAVSFGMLIKTFRLKEGPGPGVTPVEVVITDQVFLKMPYREPATAGSVKGLDFLFPVQGHPFARTAADPAVQQASFAVLIEALAPTTEGPLTHAQQLRCFDLEPVKTDWCRKFRRG